jgi:chromosome segregation ATPase
MSSRVLSSLEDDDPLAGPRGFENSLRNSSSQREQLEQAFKAKFEALRTGYNERLRRLQQMIDNFHRQLVGDEVVRAMKEDASSSVYVPAHISETIASAVAEEKEQYIHELITQLGASEMNFQELAIECRDWKERARALQREVIKMQSLISEHQLNDSQAEVLREELDRLREKVAEDVKHQHEIAGLKRAVQERDGVIEASRAELAKAKAAIASFKHQQTEFDEKYKQLHDQLDDCRKQAEAAGQVIKRESSAREATERRMKDLLEAYRQLESDHRASQQAAGLAENEVAFLQQTIQAKDAEMDSLKRKLAAVMTQVEQMLDAEAADSSSALEVMQEKLRKAKQKYSEEAKRYKRAAAVANDELNLIRTHLDDARRDLRQAQEEAKSLRQVSQHYVK